MVYWQKSCWGPSVEKHRFKEFVFSSDTASITSDMSHLTMDNVGFHPSRFRRSMLSVRGSLVFDADVFRKRLYRIGLNLFNLWVNVCDWLDGFTRLIWALRNNCFCSYIGFHVFWYLVREIRYLVHRYRPSIILHIVLVSLYNAYHLIHLCKNVNFKIRLN